MSINKKLTMQKLISYQLVLKKDSVQDSLSILENAHYASSVIISKIKESQFIEQQQMLMILDEEQKKNQRRD